MKKPILACVFIAAFAVPASPQTPIRVGAFDSIELRGGGEVVVRHGREQRVTLVSGDPNLASFEVDGDGDLVIRPCRSSCRNQKLRVEVVTPELDAVAIHGGGVIRTEGAFPARGSLALAVNGGGMLDARSIRAASVATSIHGGGRIRTSPARSLAASIVGGGAVTYTGDPRTTVSINGGGTVTRDR